MPNESEMEHNRLLAFDGYDALHEAARDLQIPALLHDVSHTVFFHVVEAQDFLLSNDALFQKLRSCDEGMLHAPMIEIGAYCCRKWTACNKNESLALFTSVETEVRNGNFNKSNN